MYKQLLEKYESIGPYIVCIEGIDGSGKDSQLQMLKDEGFYVTNEPNYESDIGKTIHKVLTKEIEFRSPYALEFLFAADRVEHIYSMGHHVKMSNKLLDKLCITGRYKYSGNVYSEIPRLTYFLNGTLPEAGLFIFLDIDPEKALNRIKKRSGENGIEIYENIEKLTIVNNEFHKIIRQFRVDPDRKTGLFPDVVIINAELSPEKIHREIVQIIKNYAHDLEKRLKLEEL